MHDYVAFMAKDENILPGWKGEPFETVLRHNFSGAYTGSWDGDAISELYLSPLEMGWGTEHFIQSRFYWPSCA